MNFSTELRSKDTHPMLLAVLKLALPLRIVVPLDAAWPVELPLAELTLVEVVLVIGHFHC